MPFSLLLAVLLVAMPLFYFAAGLLTKATPQRGVAALAGGTVAALLGAGLDAVGTAIGLWHYEVPPGSYHAPWGIYLAVAFMEAAVALIAWWLQVRFGSGALLIVIGVLAVGSTIQDYVAAKIVHPTVQVIAPGIVPAIGDVIVWSAVVSSAIAVMYTLAGSARRAQETFA